MTPVKIGFNANPTGGPGIFLTRLRSELEALGCFDAQHPDAWVELCYNAIPQHIQDNPDVKKIIRVDGVYSYRHHWVERPVTLHLPWIDDWTTRRRNARKNRPIARNLKLADQIIYQSEFSRRVTQRFIHPTPPGALIFNGVDTEQFSPAQARRQDPDTVNMLISHSFRPHKRLHEAIRIVGAMRSRLPGKQLRLHVVGGDDGRSISYAREVMREEGLSEGEILFHGKQPYDELPKIYRQCDFAFGVSFWDFCPNVIVEALSCGLPVLGVDFGGVPELVGPAGRLVKENIPFDVLELYDFKALPKVDAGQYADEAVQLLEKLEHYQTLARQRALEVLDIRITARKYYQACEAAVLGS